MVNHQLWLLQLPSKSGGKVCYDVSSTEHRGASSREAKLVLEASHASTDPSVRQSLLVPNKNHAVCHAGTDTLPPALVVHCVVLLCHHIQNQSRVLTCSWIV